MWRQLAWHILVIQKAGAKETDAFARSIRSIYIRSVCCDYRIYQPHQQTPTIEIIIQQKIHSLQDISLVHTWNPHSRNSPPYQNSSAPLLTPATRGTSYSAMRAAKLPRASLWQLHHEPARTNSLTVVPTFWTRLDPRLAAELELHSCQT